MIPTSGINIIKTLDLWFQQLNTTIDQKQAKAFQNLLSIMS